MSKEPLILGTTRLGHEVRVDTHEDSIGFPVVNRAVAVHPHTGVVQPVGERYYSDIRNILMSKQIAAGARQQAEDALLPLSGMSEAAIEAAIRYGSGGVEAHMKVHEALGNMAESLGREWQSNLHTLFHRIDEELGGKERAHERRHDSPVAFALQDAARDTEPQHGLNVGGERSTGPRQV